MEVPVEKIVEVPVEVIIEKPRIVEKMVEREIYIKKNIKKARASFREEKVDSNLKSSVE